MHIINKINMSLQTWSYDYVPENYMIFPNKFLEVYFMSGKKFSGIVKLTYNEDETEIIDVKWDEERYQKLLESYVEEEDDSKTFDDIVKENALLKAKVEALSQNQEFLEDCLIEVGQIIYA